MLDQLQLLFKNQFLSGGLMLMATGAITFALRSIPTKLWHLFLKQGTISVDVQSDDKAYDWLLVWLGKQKYADKARRVSIKHIRSNHGTLQLLMIPSRGNHWFFHRGRLLWVNRYKESNPANSSSGGMNADSFMPKEILEIRTIGRSQKTLTSLLDSAKIEFDLIDHDLAIVNRYKWGAWQTARKVKRPIESIMLPPSAESLIKDITRFTESKDWYRDMGIPYRRGYLFHGPPGTGKSSTVEAIAGKLNLPVYALNLATISDDGLEQAISTMNNDGPCILLIEDVDTVQPKREGGSLQKVSLGTLLNVLDGIHAADSVILILTSNKPEMLDSALTRHGRVDQWLEFGMATEDQIKLAITRFLGIPTLEQCLEICKWSRPISMAEVQEKLKQLVLGA